MTCSTWYPKSKKGSKHKNKNWEVLLIIIVANRLVPYGALRWLQYGNPGGGGGGVRGSSGGSWQLRVKGGAAQCGCEEGVPRGAWQECALHPCSVTPGPSGVLVGASVALVWVASARLADGGHVSAQRRRGLPSARRSKWNPPLGGLLSSLRGGSGYGWSFCSA